MRKEKIYKCENCNKDFKSVNRSPKFCSHSCSAECNNKKRILSFKTKEDISRSLSKYYENNKMFYEYICEMCKDKFTTAKRIRLGRKIHCDKCKRKVVAFKDLNNIRSILDLSKRTVSKIIKRMKIGCSNCGWDIATGDIHHINGRKIENCDNHGNLTYLCPNCHRLVHSKKIDKKSLISLENFVGDKWKEFYCKNV